MRKYINTLIKQREELKKNITLKTKNLKKMNYM